MYPVKVFKRLKETTFYHGYVRACVKRFRKRFLGDVGIQELIDVVGTLHQENTKSANYMTLAVHRTDEC